MEKGLVLFFISSNGSYFFNKADFEQYLFKQGLREGGSGGTSFPGPGLGGSEELRSSRSVLDRPKFFIPAHYASLTLGKKTGPNLRKRLFLLFT